MEEVFLVVEQIQLREEIQAEEEIQDIVQVEMFQVDEGEGRVGGVILEEEGQVEEDEEIVREEVEVTINNLLLHPPKRLSLIHI